MSLMSPISATLPAFHRHGWRRVSPGTANKKRRTAPGTPHLKLATYLLLATTSWYSLSISSLAIDYKLSTIDQNAAAQRIYSPSPAVPSSADGDGEGAGGEVPTPPARPAGWLPRPAVDIRQRAGQFRPCCRSAERCCATVHQRHRRSAPENTCQSPAPGT